jgi:hypothetical protein
MPIEHSHRALSAIDVDQLPTSSCLSSIGACRAPIAVVHQHDWAVDFVPAPKTREQSQ